jgi:hypothetical protein
MVNKRGHASESEVRDFGFRFLDVTVYFALQFIETAFVSLASNIVSRGEYHQTNIDPCHLFTLKKARTRMDTAAGQND